MESYFSLQGIKGDTVYKTIFVVLAFTIIAPTAYADGLIMRGGLTTIDVGDFNNTGIAFDISSDEISELSNDITWGFDVRGATTISDAEPADGPAMAFRFYPNLKYDLEEGVLIKVGIGYISAFAGDEIGGEYSGIGMKLTLGKEKLFGDDYLELAIGFNSGDSEDYSSDGEGEDDFTTFDVLYSTKVGDLSYGFQMQDLAADVGLDVSLVGVFVQSDF